MCRAEEVTSHGSATFVRFRTTPACNTSSVNRAAANGMSQRSARVQPAARAAYEHVRSAHAGTRTGQSVTERKQASARSGSTISSDAIKLGRAYVHAPLASLLGK